jgi:MinD-like ATPase involved in chromosome partitioning or flagellar assembly
VETITFYSYKGGVGRTLAIANVATYLALLGQKVVAVDFDLEAPGLHYKLLNQTKLSHLRGVVDYIHDALASTNGSLPNIEDYLVRVPAASVLSGEIWLLPAGAAPSPSYWEKLSSIVWHDFLYQENSRGTLFFLELKELLRKKLSPDFLLIDSRTGITEIGGVATTLLADKLVCMLLNNQENLDGARVVLRAINRSMRPPGSKRVQMVPVLSRVPVDNEIESERQSIEEVKRFLNEKDPDPENTLIFDEVLSLHSDPDLYASERILVGGDLPPDKSPLLRDYLRLFGKIVNSDVVGRNFHPIIQSALAHLLESPDEAQRELENLAFSFNLAPAFRELLKVYRLRNIEGDRILRVAEHLWHFGDDADIPLLFAVVQKDFKEMYRWHKRGFSLEFVEDVWRKSKTYDPRVAIGLAESYDNRSGTNHALSILEEAWKYSEEDNNLLARYIIQLSRTKRWEEARKLVERNRARCLEHPQLSIAWAEMECAGPWSEVPEELLEPGVLQAIDEHNPILSLELISKGGQPDEWQKRAVEALEMILEKNDGHKLYRIGRLFRGKGQWPLFTSIVRRNVEEGLAERIKTAIAEERPYLMPDSWSHTRG